MEVALHQRSALSLFSFFIAMDRLTTEVRKSTPQNIMFVDDSILCSNGKGEVDEELERWRHAMERGGMRLSRSKMECLFE